MFEVDGYLLLTTKRASTKVIGTFPMIGGAVPQKAIWVCCDLDDGKQLLLNYDAIDCDDPKIRDRLEHGVYQPDPGSDAIVKKL